MFLLRRVAVVLFSVALALNIGVTTFHLMQRNLAEAIGGSGLVGMLFGLLTVVAVILYARGLEKRGVLS